MATSHFDLLASTVASFSATDESVARLVVAPDPDSARTLSLLLERCSHLLPSATRTTTAWLPSREVLPYDTFSCPPDIRQQRLDILAAFKKGDIKTLVIAPEHLLELQPPAKTTSSEPEWRTGTDLDVSSATELLDEKGYDAVTSVMKPGEYTRRASILDLYTPSSMTPVRIEVFDGAIVSMRCFDPTTQRSTKKCDSVRVTGVQHVDTNTDLIRCIRRNWYDRFDVDDKDFPEFEPLIKEGHFAGIDAYLPLLFESPLVSFFDVLPKSTITIACEELAQELEYLDKSIHQAFAKLVDKGYPALAPRELFLDSTVALESVERMASPTSRIAAQTAKLKIDPAEEKEARLALVKEYSREHSVVLLGRRAHNAHLRKLLEQQDNEADLSEIADIDLDTPITPDNLPSPGLVSCTIEADVQGIYQTDSVTFIGSTTLDPRVGIKQNSATGYIRGGREKKLRQVEEGDLIFHEMHGLGRYLGLCELTVSNTVHEFAKIEYAANAIRYISPSDPSLATRVAPTQGQKLDVLGRSGFKRSRDKARSVAEDYVRQLLEIEVQRLELQAPQITLSEELKDEIANNCPFELTPDQAKARDKTWEDIGQAKPMDRLLSADVGYGKTEVVIQTAWAFAHSGYQTAILVPTTILAHQHFAEFNQRLENSGINVALITGTTSKVKLAQIKHGISAGSIDIVVSTHALVKSHYEFSRLGFLVIDEEHRFGVVQKERLRERYPHVHRLSLSATPLPRTLYSSLVGIRDISRIETPISGRRPVRTVVDTWNVDGMRSALLREKQRGGQSFVAVPRVHQIDDMVKVVSQAVPELSIAAVHGQMPRQKMQGIFQSFIDGELDTLVATSIIESGLDVQRANTLIVAAAEMFGLAQLHQLRGRVGRSDKQAYAYFFTDNSLTSMPRQARLRLLAIAEYHDLGAGHNLALADLETRGAGDLLGTRQWGEAHNIGLEAFAQEIENARQRLTSSDIEQFTPLPPIDLGRSSRIPPTWIPSAKERLMIYQRTAQLSAEADIEALHDELNDRFGALPASVHTMLKAGRWRHLLRDVGAHSAARTEEGIKVEFHNPPPELIAQLLKILNENPSRYRFVGQSGLEIVTDEEDFAGRVDESLTYLHENLAPICERSDPQYPSHTTHVQAQSQQ